MALAAERAPWGWLAAGRASRRLVLVVVFVALLLDNMLLTVVGTARALTVPFGCCPRVSTGVGLWSMPAGSLCRESCGEGWVLAASRTPMSGQHHSVQLCTEPENGVKSLINPSLAFLPVPIIPTFLYTTEYEGANSSAAPAQSEPAPLAQKAPFSSMFSYFDNTTVTVSGSMSTADVANRSETSRLLQPTPSSPPLPSICPEGEEFLTKENVRVGLLFASKALVQLVVNPFVGLLTNR